jgi:hypothetical protein
MYKICLLFAVLTCTILSARSTPVLPQNSLRFEILGKSLWGAGFVFEKAWRNPTKTKHPRAFSSIDASIGYALIDYIVTGIGINRNWYLGGRKKWIMNCGISGAALICLNPTPKATRELYERTQFYGGWYVNPIEPWLLGHVSWRYTFRRTFVQASIMPLLHYDRAYNRGFILWPWAGASVGINLKSK